MASRVFESSLRLGKVDKMGMQHFVGLACVANAAMHLSCEHGHILTAQCRGSVFGQGEVLCLCL